MAWFASAMPTTMLTTVKAFAKQHYDHVVYLDFHEPWLQVCRKRVCRSTAQITTNRIAHSDMVFFRVFLGQFKNNNYLCNVLNESFYANNYEYKV